MKTKSLCNLCDRSKNDDCRYFKKDPNKQVIDCGRYKPDNNVKDLAEKLKEFI